MLALGNGETLTGGGGNDTFYATVGGGKNTLTGGGGTDTYDLSRTTAGTNNVNLLKGTNGSATTAGGTDTLNNIQNVIGGSATNTINNITGNGAGSVLTGGGVGTTNSLRDGNPANGTGSATMTGNSGSTVVGASTDSFFVNSVNDKVTENFVGGVNDTVFTSLSSYTLGANLEVLKFITAAGPIGTGTFSGTGNNLGDTIVGGNGANTLTGGTGNDNMFGGTGIDTLIGGGGNDVMTGGTGSDTFKYLAAGFGKDIITDFTAHNGVTRNDQIDLSAFVPAANFATSIKSTQSGNNVLVTVGNGTTTGGTITLNNTTLANITNLDFKLG